MAAEGDDEIHGAQEVRINCLGTVAGDIDALFMHDPDGEGMNMAERDAGAEGLQHAFAHFPGKALSHMAPAGIARAQKHHPEFLVLRHMAVF